PAHLTTPSALARFALPRGTTSVVADTLQFLELGGVRAFLRVADALAPAPLPAPGPRACARAPPRGGDRRGHALARRVVRAPGPAPAPGARLSALPARRGPHGGRRGREGGGDRGGRFHLRPRAHHRTRGARARAAGDRGHAARVLA